MKKYFISFLAFLVCLVSFSSHSFAFTPIVVGGNALKIVAGSTGEKVLLGALEKAGVKTLTKSARDRAMDKWNMELYEQYMKETAENKLAYENMVKRLNQAEVIPIPNNPNYGQVVVDAAAFLLGVDILFDAADFMNQAKANNMMTKFYSDMQKGIQSGTTVASLSGVHLTYADLDTQDNKWKMDYINSAGVAAGVSWSAIGKEFPELPHYWTLDAQGSDWQRWKYWVGEHWWYDGNIKKTVFAYTSTITIKPLADFIYKAIPTEVPDLTGVVPQLDPYKTNQLDPLTDPIPATIPSTIPITIPITEPFPDPSAAPVNEPLPPPVTEPAPDPLPEPAPEPTPEPIGEEPYDPNNPTIPSGWNPINLLMPFINFLLAVVYFLIRMADWILHIPFTAPKPFPAPYGAVFDWFKEMQYGPIKPYVLMMSVANLMFGFAIYKVIRRLI